MKFIVAIAGFAFVLSPLGAMAKPHKAAHPAMHTVKMKTTCKGEFMYSKGGKCMDARNKVSS